MTFEHSSPEIAAHCPKCKAEKAATEAAEWRAKAQADAVERKKAEDEQRRLDLVREMNEFEQRRMAGLAEKQRKAL